MAQCSLGLGRQPLGLKSSIPVARSAKPTLWGRPPRCSKLGGRRGARRGVECSGRLHADAQGALLLQQRAPGGMWLSHLRRRRADDRRVLGAIAMAAGWSPKLREEANAWRRSEAAPFVFHASLPVMAMRCALHHGLDAGATRPTIRWTVTRTHRQRRTRRSPRWLKTMPSHLLPVRELC